MIPKSSSYLKFELIFGEFEAQIRKFLLEEAFRFEDVHLLDDPGKISLLQERQGKDVGPVRWEFRARGGMQ